MQKRIILCLILMMFIIPNVFAELKQFDVEIEIDIINNTISLEDENGGSKEFTLVNFTKSEDWNFKVYRDMDIQANNNLDSKINNMSKYVNTLGSSISELKSSVEEDQNFFEDYTTCETARVLVESDYNSIKTCPDEKTKCEADLKESETTETQTLKDLDDCTSTKDNFKEDLEDVTKERDDFGTQRFVVGFIGLIIGWLAHSFIYKKKPLVKSPTRTGSLH